MGAYYTGLGEWKRRLTPAPTLAWWAEQQAQRNLRALEESQGPSGPPLAPLKPSTLKRKKGGDTRPGFGPTRALAQALTAPGVVQRKSKTRFWVRGAPVGSTAEDELNFFVTGRRTVKASVRKAAKKIAKESGLRVSQITGPSRKVTAARDFFGVDEGLADEAVDRLVTDCLNQLGFS